MLGIAAAAAVVLITGELFARFGLGLGDPPLSVVHPTVEYLLKPSQDVDRFGHRVLVNAYGMRSPDFPEHRNTGTPEHRNTGTPEHRILVFGDSVLNGGNLTDHEQLATSILARELSTTWAAPVIVGNVSAGSWGPGNWLAYARTCGFFDADTVALVMSSHDTADNPTFAPLNPNTHPTERPWSALWEGVVRYLPKYLPGWRDSEEPAKPKVAADPQAEAQGLRDLADFLRSAHSAASDVVVFLWPERDELAAGVPKPGWGHAEAVCRTLALPCISLWPRLERALAEGGQPYRDHIHPNDEGQKLLAEALFAHMKHRGGE